MAKAWWNVKLINWIQTEIKASDIRLAEDSKVFSRWKSGKALES